MSNINKPSPCYKCDKRTMVCHAICKDYKDWSSERQEEIAKINKIKDQERRMANTAIERNNRMRRKRNDRRRYK